MGEVLVEWSSRLGVKLLSGARGRARKRALAFTLTIEDLERMWAGGGGRCAVSGIPFSDKRFDDALVKYPFHPSLDRIKPHSGYTPANSRLVCVAANFGMNEWGLEVLIEIAQGVVAGRGEPTPEQPTTAPKSEQGWVDAQQRKIGEAERIAEGLSGESLRKQRRRIAALKATLTRGEQGVSTAGRKAADARRKAKQEWVGSEAAFDR